MGDTRRLEDLKQKVFSGDLAAVKALVEADVDNVLSQCDPLTGSTAIHYGAFCGDLDIVAYLIGQGAEPDLQNHRGETPLHIACARKHRHVVEYFMCLDINKFPLTNNRWTCLHTCALYNSIECAEELHFTAIEINYPNDVGMTALHVAVAANNFWMTDWLLKHQAHPEAIDNLGRQAIHFACSSGSYPIVDLLLSRHVSLNTTDHKGRSIFHYACRNIQSKQSAISDVIKYLVPKTTLNTWRDDQDGAYPIMHALRCHRAKVAKTMLLIDAGKKNHCIFRTFLYTSSVDTSSSFFNYMRKTIEPEVLHMKDRYGYTPLHYAAEYDREDRITALLSMGFTPNEKANSGITPFHCAVANRSRNAVEILLENGADEDQATDEGLNALHFSAIFPHCDISGMLLASGADKFAQDNVGRTALMHLCNVSDETAEAKQLLACFLAISRGEGDCRKLIGMKDKHGWTALHYACARGHNFMAMEVVKAGADAAALDCHNRNSLHFAMLSSKPDELLTVLTFKSKSILLQRDDSGFLPVHYAAMRNRSKLVVDLLSRFKSRTKVLPQSGLPYQVTPLHLAAIYGFRESTVAILNFLKNPSALLDDCVRAMESLKLTETGREDGASPNTTFEQEERRERNYDPLTAEDNLRRIPLHYAMKYGWQHLLGELLPADRCDVLLSWQDSDGVTPFTLAAANGHDNMVKYALELLEKSPKGASVKKIVDSKKRCAAMLSITAYGSNSYKLLVDKDNSRGKDRNNRGFMHRAAFSRDKGDLLADLIKWHPNEVCAEDVNKVTPLHLACASGNVAGVKMLVENKAALWRMDSHQRTPCDWAAASGQTVILDLLFSSYEDQLQFTPFALEKACENGYFDCVKTFVEQIPEFVRCYGDGTSPLHMAALNGHKEICNLLVETGAYMDIVDKNGCTPLMVAAKSKGGEGCVEVLVNDDDCPLICSDKDGNTALHLACLHDNPNSAVLIYNALITRGELSPILLQKNKKEESLLHLAIKMNSTIMVEALLKERTKLKLMDRDNKGRIALFSMVDNPAVVENMQLVLMELIELGKYRDQSQLNDSVDPNTSVSTLNQSLDLSSSNAGPPDMADVESY